MKRLAKAVAATTAMVAMAFAPTLNSQVEAADVSSKALPSWTEVTADGHGCHYEHRPTRYTVEVSVDTVINDESGSRWTVQLHLPAGYALGVHTHVATEATSLFNTDLRLGDSVHYYIEKPLVPSKYHTRDTITDVGWLHVVVSNHQGSNDDPNIERLTYWLPVAFTCHGR